MKYKKLLIVLCYIIILCACGKSSSSEEKSSEKNKATVAFANKVDLFNALEDIYDKVNQKKYIEAYEALTEVYELSNKANIVSEKSDASSNKYIQNLNKVSDSIYNQANKQKNDEIYYSYEKSQLSIISNIAAEGDKKSSGGEGGSESGGSGGGSDSGGSESSGSGGGSSESSGGDSAAGGDQKQEQIVIPEEEALKKYPEILINDFDKQVIDIIVDLMGHVSKISLEGDNENTIAVTNREKFLLYKISSLVALNQYENSYDFISEAQNNWDKLYTKVQEKNQEDVMTLNAILKNINTSVDKKNPVAVKLQTEIAVKLLDDLATKTK